jgi:hypothetical protein
MHSLRALLRRPLNHSQPDWQLHEAQERVAQQEALVRRSIVQGAPTQAAEDQLRQLEQALLRMKEQRGHTRASEIKRKMR